MVKDQEYLNSIASQTIEYSKKLGATDVNVEVVHSISETVNLRNKQLDESNRSDRCPHLILVLRQLPNIDWI